MIGCLFERQHRCKASVRTFQTRAPLRLGTCGERGRQQGTQGRPLRRMPQLRCGRVQLQAGRQLLKKSFLKRANGDPQAIAALVDVVKRGTTIEHVRAALADVLSPSQLHTVLSTLTVALTTERLKLIKDAQDRGLGAPVTTIEGGVPVTEVRRTIVHDKRGFDDPA